jgi:hypothetical protein
LFEGNVIFFEKKRMARPRDVSVSAAERLAAVTDLLAQGIERLAMQKHGPDRAGRNEKKRQVQPPECL